jgi:hypothetical protein
MLKRVYICILVLFAFSYSAAAQKASDPLIYPDGGVISGKPLLFFWPDDRTNPTTKLTFMLTLTGEKGLNFSQSVIPSKLDDYMYFELFADLTSGKYGFRVDAFENRKMYKNSIFGYLKYPILGSFEIDTHAETSGNSAEEIIRTYRANQYNTLVNGYNGLFYGGASLVSGVAAYLLLSVFDFNIITKVAGYLAAGSAATGFGMSGYYSYRYVSFDDKKWQPEKNDIGAKKMKISFSGSF